MKKNILIANGHLKVGGVEKSLISLLNTIDYNKYNVDLILFEGLGEYLVDVPKEVKIIVWDLSKTYGSFVKVLRKSLKEKDLETIIIKLILTVSNKISTAFLYFMKFFAKTNKEYDCAIAYRVGMPLEYISQVVKAKRKVVWWHNGQFDIDIHTLKRLNKLIVKIDKIVLVSQFAQMLIEQYIVDVNQKGTIIPNMIDIVEIEKKSKMTNPYKDVDNEIILVSVGRLSPEKSMIDIVYAMDKLINNYGLNNIVWFVVGNGPEKIEIEKKIIEYGLQNKIFLVGNQSNPYPFIKNADFFIHTSNIESQGLAVIEAMALKKVCIVASSGGTNEYIVNCENAYQYNFGAKELAETIFKSLKKDNEEIKEKARKTAENYSKEKLINLFYRLVN